MGFLVSGKWLVVRSLWLLVFSFLLLLFLAACEDATVKRTVPFNGTLPETQIEISACECASGETCENGQCVCKGKTCQGKCISANACCTSAECGEGECVSGKCASTVCSVGEEFYQGECICSREMIKCKEQNKCIDQRSCCHSGQCRRDERCVPTLWKATLCAEIEGRKICRTLADNNRTEQIQTDTVFLSLRPTAWWNNGNITVNISNTTIQLAKNQTKQFDSLPIHQEGIEVIGGQCKEDED